MNLNDAGLAIIKQFEGCVLTVYRDVAGLLTIGYGHRCELPLGTVITQQQADDFLNEDVAETVQVLNAVIDVPVTENQFSACVSLAYNIGCGSFARSTLLRQINSKQAPQVCAEWFECWDKANVNGVEIVVPGLLRRREAEKVLFLT